MGHSHLGRLDQEDLKEYEADLEDELQRVRRRLEGRGNRPVASG